MTRFGKENAIKSIFKNEAILPLVEDGGDEDEELDKFLKNMKNKSTLRIFDGKVYLCRLI